MELPTIKYFLVLLCVTCTSTTDELTDDLIVQLDDGSIRGHILKSQNGKDYYAFQEIPYAAPPIGENRFQLPKKVDPWTGVLNTTKNTKICYQQDSRYENIKISEDCLYLNVYTPEKPNSNSIKLPVLIWIFGGAFVVGAGVYETFGPKYIMDHDIVVVTLNHRVGVFGFGTTEDGIIPSNIGLKDQQVVFQWVNENIHLFSGDSNQVTIAGQSSGGRSVGFHILGRKSDATELFHAGILQSGTADSLVAQVNAKEKLFNCGRNLDKNFVSNDSSDLLKLLQQAPASAIFEACGEITGTVIEKEGDFSYAPLQSWIDGNYKKIPIMIGFTSEEYLGIGVDPDMDNLASLDNDPGKLVPPLMNMSPENRNTAGRLLKNIYTNTSFETDFGAYTRWFSDTAMTNSMCKHAELVSPEIPVYLYQFSYSGKLGQGVEKIIPGAGRVSHGEDVHYMWDNGSDLSKFPEKDILTLHRFAKMWTNFVKYRNPTPENDTLLENIRWTRTDSENLVYLDFNETLVLKEHPRQFKHVKAILDKYMQPPLNYY